MPAGGPVGAAGRRPGGGRAAFLRGPAADQRGRGGGQSRRPRWPARSRDAQDRGAAAGGVQRAALLRQRSRAAASGATVPVRAARRWPRSRALIASTLRPERSASLLRQLGAAAVPAEQLRQRGWLLDLGRGSASALWLGSARHNLPAHLAPWSGARGLLLTPSQRLSPWSAGPSYPSRSSPPSGGSLPDAGWAAGGNRASLRPEHSVSQHAGREQRSPLDTYSHATDTLSFQAADMIDAPFASSISPESPRRCSAAVSARAESRPSPRLRTTSARRRAPPRPADRRPQADARPPRPDRRPTPPAPGPAPVPAPGPRSPGAEAVALRAS
jgi:hypothetical protein